MLEGKTSPFLLKVRKPFLLILFSYIGTLAGLSQDMFVKIEGYTIDSYLTESTLTSPELGLGKCALLCLSTSGCVSLSNNKITGDCRLSQLSPYGETTLTKDDNWDTLYRRTDGFTVVFRAVSGNGVNVLDSWNGEGSSVKTSDCIIPYKTTCNTHYRSNMIDLWEELNISEVKIEVYTGSYKNAYMTFNGANTNRTNWFSQGNLMDSSWPGLQSETSFNGFHIEGIQYAYTRHFYINKQHGACVNDLGWFMVLDVESPHEACIYDYQTRPAIMYSFQSSGTYWQSQAYGLAETMLIYVK